VVDVLIPLGVVIVPIPLPGVVENVIPGVDGVTK